MSSPIKQGDLCKVIDGALGAKSPNVGLVVSVLSFQGEHSKFGRIWRCKAEYAELAQPGVNTPPGTADFAQSWLRKIDPPPQTKSQTTETNLSKELTT